MLAYTADGVAEDVEVGRRWVEKWREGAIGMGGYAVVMDMPGEWSGAIERWGYEPEAVDLMRRLKGRGDAEGILNVGEFVV